MNLKYITFFLCAGICTSTLLNDVVAMNGNHFPNINQKTNGNGQFMRMPQQGNDMRQRIQQWNVNATNSQPSVQFSMQPNGINVNFTIPLKFLISAINQQNIGGQKQNQFTPQMNTQFPGVQQIDQQQVCQQYSGIQQSQINQPMNMQLSDMQQVNPQTNQRPSGIQMEQFSRQKDVQHKVDQLVDLHMCPQQSGIQRAQGNQKMNILSPRLQDIRAKVDEKFADMRKRTVNQASNEKQPKMPQVREEREVKQKRVSRKTKKETAGRGKIISKVCVQNKAHGLDISLPKRKDMHHDTNVQKHVFSLSQFTPAQVILDKILQKPECKNERQEESHTQLQRGIDNQVIDLTGISDSHHSEATQDAAQMPEDDDSLTVEDNMFGRQ